MRKKEERKEISIKDMLRPLPRYLIAGLIMLAVVMFLGSRLDSTFINTMITIAIGAGIYILVSYLFLRILS